MKIVHVIMISLLYICFSIHIFKSYMYYFVIFMDSQYPCNCKFNLKIRPLVIIITVFTLIRTIKNYYDVLY